VTLRFLGLLNILAYRAKGKKYNMEAEGKEKRG
jgi:hypothetical protein